MELKDSAFPLVHGIVGTDDANTAFKDADAIFLVGSRPRTKDMDRPISWPPMGQFSWAKDEPSMPCPRRMSKSSPLATHAIRTLSSHAQMHRVFPPDNLLQ